MATKTVQMKPITDFLDAARQFCVACGIDPDEIVSESLVEAGKSAAVEQIATEMALLVMRYECDNAGIAADEVT